MNRPVALLALLVLSGSAFGQSVEGKWNVTYAGKREETVTVLMRAGKMTLTIAAERGGRTVRIVASGTYVRKGDRLTSKLVGAELDPATLTPQQRAATNTPEARRARRKRMRPRPGPEGRIVFRGKDRFVLTPTKGATSTFTRAR